MAQYDQALSLHLLWVLTPVGLAIWMATIWFPLRWLMGLKLKERLREITLPEAVLIGLFSMAAADLVRGLLSRYV